jgi:hypothetical protein
MQVYSYSRRAATPTEYADEMDAAFIAQQVINNGKSPNWAFPKDAAQLALAQRIEHDLSRFNIGVIEYKNGTWGHKPGGSHVFK